MNPTTYSLFVLVSTLLAIAAVVFALAFFGDRLAKRNEAKRVKILRTSGVIPAADKASDADVIHLANDNKREAAALLYVSLHGVRLEKARLVVGSPTTSNRLIAIVGAVLLCAILMTIAEAQNKEGLATIWVANAVLFSAAWMKTNLLVAKNRKTLAAGKIPSPDEHPWKEPARTAR